MILRDNGRARSEGSSEKCSSSSEIKALIDDAHYEGNLYMLRRLIRNLVGKETKCQRDTSFHSRCLDFGKFCSHIIDRGSCVNEVSLRLMEKLAIPTLPHPKPYNLKWVSEKGKQVSLAITFGIYKDNIFHDVMPREETHILLGRPWKFDRKVTYDEVSNKLSFVYLGEKVVLKPVSLREVSKDQIKMRIKREEERKEKEKVEKAREKKREKRREKK
ncbi:hypothetical protein CR513_26065, partial [Mucuna pruriens]